MRAGEEKRKGKRDPCSVKVDYALDSPSRKADCGPWSNLTFDISSSGMGLYTDRRMEPGQKLRIYLRHVSKDPVVAEVTWCDRLSKDVFKVGLRYC